MNRVVGPVAAALIALALLASASLYTVDQRQNAMVFQLGEVKDVVTQPGLHFKWPLIQNIRYFDTRILTLDDPEPLRRGRRRVFEGACRVDNACTSTPCRRSTRMRPR